MVEMVETRKCAVLFVRPAMRNLRHLAPPIGGLEGISTTLLLLGSEVLGGEERPETSRTGVNTGKPAVSQPSSKLELTASRRRSGSTRLEASLLPSVTALHLHGMAPRLTPFSLGLARGGECATHRATFARQPPFFWLIARHPGSRSKHGGRWPTLLHGWRRCRRP